MDNTEFKLRCRIAQLEGLVEGLTAWERDRVWRRALLEKLLTMEGYDRCQINNITTMKVKNHG